MNLNSRIILRLFKFALVIGVAGGLTDLIFTMRSEAVKAHKQGLVSLKRLNQALVGP